MKLKTLLTSDVIIFGLSDITQQQRQSFVTAQVGVFSLLGAGLLQHRPPTFLCDTAATLDFLPQQSNRSQP
jgi:hypothetical protein